jgi:hypothetical protein
LYTCAIKSGALYCWGYNGYGQLGDGTTTNSNTPVAVTNMGSGVTAVAAGAYHTCAIKSGALYCWGLNNYGQLGASSSQTCGYYPYSYSCSTTPLAVTNMGSGVTAVAAGGWHSLGPEGHHLPVRLGGNGSGQLGDGGTSDSTTPVQVSGGCGWGITLPAPFSKTAPVSGAVGLPTTVVLSWTAPASGTLHHYRYCLATTPGCTPSTQVVSTTTSVTVSGLTPGATYHWQVRACANSTCDLFTDANGSGGHWAFTVAAVGPFSKAQPVSGATGLPTTVVLSWTAPATGTVDHYRYCLATTPGCTPVTPTTATSATLTGLTPLTTYYWQVRACAESTCDVSTDADGSGGHWSFTVAPLEPFGKLEPAHGATGLPFAANNIQLRWEAMTYATGYEVCIGTLPDACDVLSWQNLGNATQWTINFPLASAASYWWQVRAVMGSTQVPATAARPGASSPPTTPRRAASARAGRSTGRPACRPWPIPPA